MSTIKFTPDDGLGTVSRDVFQSVCNELADARNERDKWKWLAITQAFEMGKCCPECGWDRQTSTKCTCRKTLLGSR